MTALRTHRRLLEIAAGFLAGAVAMALVALAAGLWNGTSKPVMLDTNRVAAAIESSIRAQRKLSSSVRCPVDIIQRRGILFECQAVVDARTYPVIVSEVDGAGHVRFLVT